MSGRMCPVYVTKKISYLVYYSEGTDLKRLQKVTTNFILNFTGGTRPRTEEESGLIPGKRESGRRDVSMTGKSVSVKIELW